MAYVLCTALDCGADDPDDRSAHQGVAAAPFISDETGAERSDEGAGGHGGCDLDWEGLDTYISIDRFFLFFFGLGRNAVQHVLRLACSSLDG
jgi:hypothetical protein